MSKPYPKLHITMDELAQKLGYETSYIRKILRGYFKPSWQLAQQIEIQTRGDVRWTDLLPPCPRYTKHKTAA